jgi:MOSC domain-containing protein YiiM
VRHATLVRSATRGGPTVREAFVALFSGAPDGEALRRIHDTPGLAQAWRHTINRKIAALPD